MKRSNVTLDIFTTEYIERVFVDVGVGISLTEATWAEAFKLVLPRPLNLHGIVHK